MKNCFVVLLAVFLSAPSLSFAQQIVISGEAKTGIIWERVENRLGNPDSLRTEARLGSLDDAGSGDGRFRINMAYTSAGGNVGFRARLNWENFNNAPTNGPHWDYAFGWANMFNDQFTLSLGKLGGSPWGTGGPEMWRELEVTDFGGLRFEWKPNFVPGNLNIGFVLNWIDDIADAGMDRDATLMDLLLESVVGVSYSNDWFLARVAYRFDSEMDQGGARAGLDPFDEGGKLVYRVEEFVLRRFVPNLAVWALGEFEGVGSELPEVSFMTRNWLFIEYAPPAFTALLRLGFDATYARFIVHASPSFSYNFLGGLLVPSVRFRWANDFGDAKIWPGSWFSHIGFEPSIRLNLAMGVNIDFAYYWRLENRFGPPGPPEMQTQMFNLRAGIVF